MLKSFGVKNYRGFKELDFSLVAREYSFGRQLVRDGVVNKALVYGRNGSGKTSLGLAIFDIVSHLTDTMPLNSRLQAGYLNLAEGAACADFRYVFQFDFREVLYEYSKSSADNLLRERLSLDGKTLLDYDYSDGGVRSVSPELAPNLRVALSDNRVSVLKYVWRSTPTDQLPSPIVSMLRFVEGMLWFRSLSDGNSYLGFANGNSTLVQMLYRSGKLREFTELLRRNGLDYSLRFEGDNDRAELIADFGDGKRSIPFLSIASAGTVALLLLFDWLSLASDRLSLLFIDEFDAFYHYGTAASVLEELNARRSFQTILTTHNTHLMENGLTRPDCCFLLDGGQITSLRESTKRELREAHSLENLYVNGAFAR